jgi:hypothetical protein
MVGDLDRVRISFLFVSNGDGGSRLVERSKVSDQRQKYERAIKGKECSSKFTLKRIQLPNHLHTISIFKTEFYKYAHSMIILLGEHT